MNIQNITFPSYYKDNCECWYGFLSPNTAFQVFDGDTFNAIVNSSLRAAVAGEPKLIECSKGEFIQHYEFVRTKTHFGLASFATPAACQLPGFVPAPVADAVIDRCIDYINNHDVIGEPNP